MSKARGLADLGNVYNDGALSNRNILINGNFAVSQRGDFTSPSTWGSGFLSYSLDRWTIKRSGMTGTIQDLGNRVKVVASTPSGAGTDQMMIQQIIEDKNINHLVGKTITLSALVKTNRSDCRVMYEQGGGTGWMGLNVDVSSNTHSGGGADERLYVTFSLPSNMTGIELRAYVGFDTVDSVGGVSLSAGDWFEASEVQLEVGDTATPFEHRSYGQELALCQRYYQGYFTLGAVYAPKTSTDGYNVLCGTLPTLMRASPTLVETSNYGWVLISNGRSYEFYRSPATNALTPSWTADAEL